MMYLFQLTIHVRHLLRLAVVSFGLLLPTEVWSIGDDVLLYSVDLKPEETQLVESALALLVAKNPAYNFVAVRGQMENFYGYSGANLNTKTPKDQWVSITGRDLANWIAARPYSDKPIVLISSCNDDANQKLANALWLADKKVDSKRTKKRSIIGWSESVLVFENGHVIGYGSCKAFSPIEATDAAKSAPILLSDKNMPQFPDFNKTSNFVELSKDKNLLCAWIDELKNWDATELKALKRSATNLKYDSRKSYNDMVAQRKGFEGWRYLWQLEYREWIVSNIDFALAAAAIEQQYSQNTKFSVEDREAYETAFKNFLASGDNKLKTIQELSKPGLTLAAFQTQVKISSESTTLIQFWKMAGDLPKDANPNDPTVERLAPNNIEERQLRIIGSTEKRMEQELRGKTTRLPSLVREKLQELWKGNIIKNNSKLEPARRQLTGVMNPLLGTSINFPTLLDLTNPISGLIKQPSSWGSIFESWLEHNIFKNNKGKKTFIFDNKDNFQSNPPATLPNGWKEHIPDGHYLEKVKKGNIETEVMVGLEMKHYQAMTDKNGKISYGKVDLVQLNRNAKLIEAGVFLRIEYIFSSLEAATANKIVFLSPNSGFKTTDIDSILKIFYINSNGIKVGFK